MHRFTTLFKSPFSQAGAVLTVSLLLFGGGMYVGATRSGALTVAAASQVWMPNPPAEVDFSPVWLAWKAIDDRFVPGRIATTTASTTPTGYDDPQERVWGMIQGLAGSLGDPYTVFLPPADNEIFEADISGSFEGVGMEIAIRDGVLTVVSPLKGNPAEKAGIKALDRIHAINGVKTDGMDVGAAVKLIRGPKGTPVSFEILREGEGALLAIEVIRDVVKIPTIQAEKRPDGVFVIELYNFSAVSADLFRTALQEFADSGSDKLILDVRGNPGGYLQAAVEMTSWFLPGGSVVVTEDYGKRADPIIHRSRGYDVFTDKLKMVVLVDKGSASASEILAGALKHYKKAIVVGTHTFGKGSVQELVDITPETSLKITVARWLGPDGLQIPDNGIAPDVEVTPTKEEQEKGVDVALEKAVEVLLQKK